MKKIPKGMDVTSLYSIMEIVLRKEGKRRGETKESETAQNRGWLTKFMYEGGCAFEPRDSRRVEFRSLLADASR